MNCEDIVLLKLFVLLYADDTIIFAEHSIEDSVDNCGVSYLWLIQSIIDINQLIHTRMEDVVLYKWYTYISTWSMCTIYILFKKQLNFEDYLLSSNYRERISLTKYRCANSKIPVYNQLYMYDTVLFTSCDIINGDEYHYIIICPYFRQSMKLYFKHNFYT